MNEPVNTAHDLDTIAALVKASDLGLVYQWCSRAAAVADICVNEIRKRAAEVG